MTCIFDIETNGLVDSTTLIHSLCIYSLEEGKMYSCTDNSKEYLPIDKGLDILANADVIVGHNIICFDVPVLRKLFNFKPKGKVIDTIVLSRLIHCDKYKDDIIFNQTHTNRQIPSKLLGSHSLKAWGYRLSELKDTYGETTDWVTWTVSMQTYCEQDVRVTKCLYEYFCQLDYSKEAIKLEHKFQEIIYQQEVNGFPFDFDKAEKLFAELSMKREELKTKLQDIFPPVDKGEWFTPRVNNKKRGYVKGVKIWKPKIVTFNPASRDEIAARLIEKYGWQPTELSETGKVKIDDEILQELPYPEAKQLAEYFLLQKRLGQIGEGAQAWLKCAVKENYIYKIHGRVTTNGAVTGRCTHHNPNIAQVPAVGVPYGEECRSLFYAPKGYLLVGCDASALELRCLSHFMAKYDGGNYADVILNGDVHWKNTQALGLVGSDEKRDKNNEHHNKCRQTAKKFIYAFLKLYGTLHRDMY